MLARDERFVVLTHDDMRDAVQQRIGGSTLVLGVRDAKGLEFDCVVCYNIVSDSPTARRELAADVSYARAKKKSSWAYVLTCLEKREHQRASTCHGVDREIEGELMLLYTAVTRCRSRLIVCETAANSAAANAMERWLFSNTLASVFIPPTDSECSLTREEWCAWQHAPFPCSGTGTRGAWNLFMPHMTTMTIQQMRYCLSELPFLLQK